MHISYSIKKDQWIALGVTAAVALLLLLMLHVTSLSLARIDTWPPERHSDIALADEEFFEVFDDADIQPVSNQSAAPVKTPEPQHNASTPAPSSGTDVKDSGTPADAPTTVTSKTPSAVKQQEQTAPQQTGPSKEEIERQKAEEEARRKANAAVASSFQKSTGSNNTSAKGTTTGNTGSPTGKSTSINGKGTGSVGGGWALPRYAEVPSSMTGSIKIRVKIDRDGKPVSLTFEGGDAPAATDAKLRAAVKAEVMSKEFTRSTANPPADATAYITYIFK